MPKFSIVIPVYKTPEKFLKEMLDSIVDQTYAKLGTLHRGRQSGRRERGECLKEICGERTPGSGIRSWGKTCGISGNTNAALEMAEGDFIVLADHDDRLTPNALFECAKKLNENQTAMSSIPMRTSWIWMEMNCLTRILSRISIRTF